VVASTGQSTPASPGSAPERGVEMLDGRGRGVSWWGGRRAGRRGWRDSVAELAAYLRARHAQQGGRSSGYAASLRLAQVAGGGAGLAWTATITSGSRPPGCLVSAQSQRRCGMLTRWCPWSRRWNPTGDPSLTPDSRLRPEHHASRRLRSSSGTPCDGAPRSSPGLKHADRQAVYYRELGRSSRSAAAVPNRRLLAGAATVALSRRNAAGTGECGRRWSQLIRECPPPWSQFGRSPAVRG
jgi:hypothetical protein